VLDYVHLNLLIIFLFFFFGLSSVIEPVFLPEALVGVFFEEFAFVVPFPSSDEYNNDVLSDERRGVASSIFDSSVIAVFQKNRSNQSKVHF
jgi:hypothetical protein